MTPFLTVLYLFDSIFQGQLGLISGIILIKEFISQTIFAMEIGKRLFFSYHSNRCYEKKSFMKNLNFIDLNCCWKIGLLGLMQGEIKSHNVQNVHFYKKVAKVKNVTWNMFNREIVNKEIIDHRTDH